MKFVILKPTKPIDPRSLKLESDVDLHAQMPAVIECATEREAMTQVRRILPDAAAMPLPLKVGAGEVILLGLVDDPHRKVGTDIEIPFALCVQPVPENSGDRYRIKKDRHRTFDAKLWRVPPVRPELAQEFPVELRATDLELPTVITARLGADQHGRSTIYLELGGIEMSITSLDNLLQLR